MVTKKQGIIDWIMENITDWNEEPEYTREKLEKKTPYDLLNLYLTHQGISGYTGRIIKKVEEAFEVDLNARKFIEPEKERKEGETYIKLQTAIMSHLSDCQEMLSLRMNIKTVSEKINFIKMLILSYEDLSVEVSEEELNEVWKKVSSH